MDYHCLPPRQLPHTTKLYAAFLEGLETVHRFYAHPPTLAGAQAAAREVALSAEARRQVVDVLREQNRAFGSDGSTERSLDGLASGAVAVVTGQQVSLFGGPAFSFYKALTAVAVARRMMEAGSDAVPVFWLAAEDHDQAEVNHCYLPAADGLARIELPIALETAGRSVGVVRLGEGVAAAVEQAVSAVQGPGAEGIAVALRDAYRSGETYASAFGRLMARVLAGWGIVLLDPLDARLHRLAAPIYRGAVESREELSAALLERGKELERAGFHAQVKTAEVSTLLFVNVEGRREPLRWRNGTFAAADRKLSPTEVLAWIDREPEAFSGNVLLRPVVQDALLPTAAYVGGPAEVAYLAQAEVVYRRLLSRMPAVLGRAGFTLVTPAIERLLKKYELTVADVLAGRQKVRGRMEAQSVSKSLLRQFDAGEKSIRGTLNKLRAPLKRLDPTLAEGLETAEQKMLYQYSNLRAKAGRAQDFRSGVLDRHEKMLLEMLYPHHGLQERTVSFLWFLAQQGSGLLDEIERRCSAENTQHQVLFL